MDRFPRVQRYLDGLPQGFDSYPAVLQKSAVYRQFLKLGAGVDVRALPGPLGNLALDPPPVTAWITEVHATATYLGLADLHGWNDTALVAQCRTLNRELLSSPLYRVLMFVVSPAILVRGAPDRWLAMHKGIVMTSRIDSATSGEITLAFPKRLVPRVMAHCYGGALQAALDVARLGSGTIAVEQTSEERAVYSVDWR